MVLHIIRVIFLLIVVSVTLSYAFQHDVLKEGPTAVTVFILAPTITATLLVIADIFWHRKRLQVLSGLFFGLLAGLVIGYALTIVVDLAFTLFPAPSVPTVHLIKLLLGMTTVFVCVTFVLQTKDDFRFVVPYVEFTKETKGPRQLLLDTSVIIDGRIADISETRILESELVVPRFVLAELQAIADSDDKLKRNRGRRGLDVLNRLRTSQKVDIKIMDANVPSVREVPDVDTKLVALAKHMDGRIMTNDYNLNKVAQLRGVDVININDLANALKPIVLPGENMHVKVIKPGEEMGQGIGYLEDGTMVVAEQGREYIGKEIVIVVTSVLQTSAGRMIFGKLDVDKTLNSHRK